jgi:hypothetical protein
MFLHESQQDWKYSFNRAFIYMILFYNNVHNGVDVVHRPDFQPWTLLTCSGFAEPGLGWMLNKEQCDFSFNILSPAHLGGRIIHLLSSRHPLVSGGA